MYFFKSNDTHFELIIVKQKNNRYKATSPSFPYCKGFGDSKDNAVNQLCNSISNYVKAHLKSFLVNHLSNKENYNEVITDLNNKDTFNHHIISINNRLKFKERGVFLKSINTIANQFQSLSNHDSHFPFKIDGLSNFSEKNSEENDDMILGIQLCLN